MTETPTAFAVGAAMPNLHPGTGVGGLDPCGAPAHTLKASLFSVPATSGATGCVWTRPNSREHKPATPCVTSAPASWLCLGSASRETRPCRGHAGAQEHLPGSEGHGRPRGEAGPPETHLVLTRPWSSTRGSSNSLFSPSPWSSWPPLAQPVSVHLARSFSVPLPILGRAPRPSTPGASTPPACQ